MEYIITQETAGKSVKDFLRRDCNLSSSLLRKLKTIPHGITLDGKQVTVRAVLEAGQTLCIKDEDLSSSENILPTEGFVDIVYEDDSLMIINKPFGMPVHPSAGHGDDTLANILAGRFKKEGVPFVFRAVNRLDSNTGGLMCVAKNAHSAKVLSEKLNEKAIKRVYEAILVGTLKEKEGTIDAPIGMLEGSSLKRCVRPDGERAITHYTVIEEKNGLTRAEIILETGRTHQIRVHFSDLGCPVWGDFLYGTEKDFKGHALFSKKIEFLHPLTQKNICINVPVPELFDLLMEKGKNTPDAV